MFTMTEEREIHPFCSQLLEQLLSSPANLPAFAAVQVVALKPARIGNPLLIQGPKGSGKTRLLHYFHRELRRCHPTARIFPLPAAAFFEPGGELLKVWKQALLNEPPSGVWAVLIDGIEVLDNQREAFEFLARFVAYCIQAGGQVVLTGSLDELDVNEATDRIQLSCSRMLRVDLGVDSGSMVKN
ncbi:hypothetical protein DESUT3_34970 [Desulfuromonas versatilis]|uniref:Chromosomal replication initiator protein DnaA ATPAse domain-containing protein n=1 Tax=Desulfuromonas versatilis TaxID=2802975 RepID=A0ABM8I087_9BACT|nr:DnaA/Hda family protein [Desulfuromonas versatilis]BCR06428.1 hypothetical protein DESUT3_34970 [Desulfuromonas versatilis]